MACNSGSGLQTEGLSLLIANFYFRVQSDKRHTCWYRGSFCPQWKCCCWKLKMLSLMPLFSSILRGLSWEPLQTELCVTLCLTSHSSWHWDSDWVHAQTAPVTWHMCQLRQLFDTESGASHSETWTLEKLTSYSSFGIFNGPQRIQSPHYIFSYFQYEPISSSLIPSSRTLHSSCNHSWRPFQKAIEVSESQVETCIGWTSLDFRKMFWVICLWKSLSAELLTNQ